MRRVLKSDFGIEQCFQAIVKNCIQNVKMIGKIISLQQKKNLYIRKKKNYSRPTVKCVPKVSLTAIYVFIYPCLVDLATGSQPHHNG